MNIHNLGGYQRLVTALQERGVVGEAPAVPDVLLQAALIVEASIPEAEAGVPEAEAGVEKKSAPKRGSRKAPEAPAAE